MGFGYQILRRWFTILYYILQKWEYIYIYVCIVQTNHYIFHYIYMVQIPNNEAFEVTAIYDLLQFGGISSSMEFGFQLLKLCICGFGDHSK